MDNRYVKCNCCGKRIYFGEEVFHYKGYCGIYCSAECFSDAFGEVQELDFDFADNCCAKIYDDEKRKMELKEQMENLLKQMDLCKEELKELCNSTK